MTPVGYHEAAEEELLNEIGYLELRVSGLGRRFLAEVRRAESLIAQFPESAEEIRAGIRKRILRKFRYLLMYSIVSRWTRRCGRLPSGTISSFTGTPTWCSEHPATG